MLLYGQKQLYELYSIDPQNFINSYSELIKYGVGIEQIKTHQEMLRSIQELNNKRTNRDNIMILDSEEKLTNNSREIAD